MTNSARKRESDYGMQKNDDIKLDFKPLSEGLGFHPFANGLPYAPVTKKETPRPQGSPAPQSYMTGAGAVAAGPARYVPATPGVPRVSVPVAQLQSQAQTSTQAQAQQQLEAMPQLEAEFGFVYLFKRVLAYGIDLTLNVALCATAMSLVLVRQDVDPMLVANPGVLILTGVFLIFFNWALITAQEIAFGTTIGKRIFGLALQGSVSALFLRAFFFLPSIGFGGVGILWALFDRKRRCWHDIVVDTQPIEIAQI